MKKFLLALALSATVLMTSACQSTKPLSPTYLPPSTAATRMAVTSGQEKVKTAQTYVTSAQGRAKSATTKLSELEKGVSDTPILLKLVVDARNDIDQLTTELIHTQEALASAQVSLAEAQNHATSLQLRVNDQTKTLNSTIETSNRNAAEATAAKKAYHRLKFYACSLGAALAFFVIWKFKVALAFLGPWSLAAFIAGPAAIFGLLWLLL